eukprot:TRINITY_DN9163_c0_g1_i1.p1 TRINITY_DN9163_c0_g1~~TRINITY_DN9163_c0_g1_i1.p1  ORF type:complete len:125 (-),score=27.06 TRINITY_DN9163_c0_g1_i1:191-565(-)
MLVYLILAKPFKDVTNNVVNTYNELVIVACFLSVLAMNVTDFSESAASIWGWVLIGLILISLFSIWVIVIPDVVSAVYDYLKSCKKGKAGEVSKEEMVSVPTKFMNSSVIKKNPIFELKECEDA